MMSEGKILIVDDEKDFAFTLAERLNIRNFDAIAVNCAEDALSLIHGNYTPDVVLLDLKMPLMDGFETLQAIKAYNSAIEVIILTGHGSAGLNGGGGGEDVFDFVMKPVAIDELIVKLKQAVVKKRGGGSSPEKG
jgi:DNA-binding NtrC family response regulator